MHKVPGNFHISSHDAQEAVINLFRENYKLDFTHKINHLSFGKKSDSQIIQSRYGETIPNELSGRELVQNIPFGQLYVNYFLDITEMEYTDVTYKTNIKDETTGDVTYGNPTYIGFQYRSMFQQMITNQLPTIVFNTSITPMKVHYTISYQPLSEFLVHICAIIGGVFAAASIFESMLH